MFANHEGVRHIGQKKANFAQLFVFLAKLFLSSLRIGLADDLPFSDSQYLQMVSQGFARRVQGP
jgi:hypothetical protein